MENHTYLSSETICGSRFTNLSYRDGVYLQVNKRMSEDFESNTQQMHMNKKKQIGEPRSTLRQKLFFNVTKEEIRYLYPSVSVLEHGARPTICAD